MAPMSKKNCRFCHDAIGLTMIAQHERLCEKRTPEERAKSKAQRDSYHRFTAAHANGNGRDRYRESLRIPNGHTTKGYHHPQKQCRYCHDEVSQNALARHEKACAKATPELRAKRRHARDAARHKPDRQQPNYVIPVPTQAKKMGRPLGSKNSHHGQHNVFANGKGRRLSVMVSVDFQTFRQLIMELAPSLSIDKVELL